MPYLAWAGRVPWRFQWAGVAYLLLITIASVLTWGWLQEPTTFAPVLLIIVTMPTAALLTEVDLSAIGLSPFALLVGVGLAQAALLFTLCRFFDIRLL